jgi:hypothetical protein
LAKFGPIKTVFFLSVFSFSIPDFVVPVNFYEPNHPLTKLPANIDLTLYLIREELKSQKFFLALHKAGIDDIYYQPRLGKAILMNMDDGKRAKKIKPDRDNITKQAFKVYHELVAEKKRRAV